MSEDQGPVVRRAILVGELSRLRKEAGLTQKQVASRLDWSSAKVIRIEGGKQSITQTDLEAMLRLYGLDEHERIQQMLELNRGANRDGWWSKYRGQLDLESLRMIGYEAGASIIRQSHNAVVPGMLQTQEYAELIIRLFQRDADKVAPLVRLRMERQARIAEREVPPRQIHVLDEAVIRRHVGARTDPGIMPRQLRKVAELARSEDVEVRVIPFGAGSHHGMRGPILVLSFDGSLGDIAYLEGASDGSFTDRPDLVADYNERFENLLESSLGQEESIEMIVASADSMLE